MSPAPAPGSSARPPVPEPVPRARGRRRRGMAVALAATLAGGFPVLVALLAPLPASSLTNVVSSYGVHDNRRLLLLYGALVAGALLALAVLRRGRPRGAANDGAPGAAEQSGAAEGEPTAAAAPSKKRPGPWLLPLLLLGAGALFLGPGLAYHPLNGHEVLHLGYLSQIRYGRLLNVDTMTIYGPLLGYSEYLFMRLTSFSVLGFRYYWSTVNAATFALLLALAWGWFRHRALLLPLALWWLLATSLRAYLPDARGIQAGFWGWGNILRHGWVALVGLGFAGWLSRTHSPLPRVLLGVALACGVQYSPETSLPAAALGALALLCHPPGRARPVAAALAALAGAVVGTLLLLAPVVWRGALGAYLENAARIPGLYLRGVGNRPYPAPLGGAGDFITFYALPAALLAAVLLWGRRVGGGAARPALVFTLALAAALSFVSVLVRGDRDHLLNATTVPLLVLFLTLDEWAAGGRPRRLPGAARWVGVAALLPLLALSPGPLALARGVIGRVAHPLPAPPAGYRPIPLARAGIWVPTDTTWYDGVAWGREPGADAVEVIGRLARGHRVHIMGMRASTYYFLADALSAGPFTDLSAECLTRDAYARLWQELRTRPPDYVFTEAADLTRAPTEAMGFRRLGIRAGYLVSQNLAQAPIALDSMFVAP